MIFCPSLLFVHPIIPVHISKQWQKVVFTFLLYPNTDLSFPEYERNRRSFICKCLSCTLVNMGSSHPRYFCLLVTLL
jgi:hypothetical protein